MAGEDEVKKKLKQNMSLEEFAKLTPEEKKEYKRQGDKISSETEKAIKETKEKPFKRGGSVKGKCKIDGIAIRGKTRAKQRRS